MTLGTRVDQGGWGISVLVPTLDRGEDLRRMLGTLAACDPPRQMPWEAVVVDNGSSDGTPAVLAAFARRLPLRSLREPRRGRSYALNAGIAAARYDVLAFTDDDVLVEPSWLTAIERAATDHPDALGFGGRVVADWSVPPPVWLSDGRPFTRTNGGVVAHDIGDVVVRLGPGVRPPPGANVVYRRRAFERYGLFREDLGPGRGTYGEDTEMVKRLVSAGETVLYVPTIVLRHPVAPERLRQGYGLRWSFRLGRGAVRARGRRRSWRSVGGIPLFAARALAREVVQLVRLGGLPRTARAYDALQEVAYRWGVMYEYARLPRDFDPARFVPRLDVTGTASPGHDSGHARALLGGKGC